ncbi:MAG: ABC transporter substrate-binding protein [Proteobacteria bacterium]|nr:MAG: ABC transporter substrate-binding protein [Pseudomonadota bacterium]
MKKNVLLICAGLLLALSPSAFAKKTYKWKLAMSWPATLSPLTSPANNFAKLVEQMSDGRLKVKVHASNVHKAPFGILDMVKAGNYEMGHSASYFWKGKDINTPFFTSMPFGMNYAEFNSWFYYGGGEQLMEKVYKKQGVYSFPGGNTGVQMGGWFRKEIKSVADLKGLKIRIPGYAGEIYSKLGAVVTSIKPGEFYTALERGTIDAVEWVAPALDMKMGFQKVAKYYYSAWHEPASDTQFLINRKAYDKLPKDLQAIVKVAMQAVSADFNYEHFNMNIKALNELNTNFKDVKIMQFPKSVLEAMKKANDQIIAELEKKGGITKEIIDSQRDYQNKARAWTKISEHYYLKSMFDLEK